MHPQLPFAPILTLLLITSFTTVGILALWAATSSRPWFWRTLAYLAVLSPLLTVPAYEPFIAYAVDGLIVATGVRIYRSWKNRTSSKSAAPSTGTTPARPEFRFSLLTLLYLTALVALLTPIASQLPPLNLRAWASVVAAGASCGLVTLIAAQLALRPRKWLTWPIGLLLCAAVGYTLAKTEWIVPSITFQSDWPPTGATPSPYSLYTYTTTTGTAPPTILSWPIALPTIATLLAAIIFLAIVVAGRPRKFSRTMAALAITLIAAFPAYVLWQLMHPLPYPIVQLPSPNGYDDFTAAGNAFNTSPILNTVVEPKSTDELAAEVAKFTAAYAQVRVGLSRPSDPKIWPSDRKTPLNSSNLPDIQSIRSVARAFGRESELALQQQRFRDAAMSAIDGMRIGDASSHNGILLNYLVGIAVVGIGQYNLYPTIAHLNVDESHQVLDALQHFDQNQEPIEGVLHRDRIYDENYLGWYGHLLTIISDFDNSRFDSHSAVLHTYARANTMTRLLSIELALHEYHLRNNAYPDHLDELVPKYLPAVPIDPYSPTGEPMRYEKTAEGPLAYSVGTDGDDDGGRPSSRDSAFLDDGDIRLDTAMAPYPDETQSGFTTDNSPNNDDKPVDPKPSTP
jgi:hypothetical protein